MIKNTLTFLAFCAVTSATWAQSADALEKIRINQVGFYPDGPKKAVVITDSPAEFYIVATGKKDTVFRSKLSPVKKWNWSEENAAIADFSQFNKPGTYKLAVKGLGNSYDFEIKPKVHLEVARASLKGFYFQRASTALPEKYAGQWKRAAGHPDNEVLIHNSAATAQRPANSKISSPRGWYDAGDYNKYIVNSGISMGTLLSLYEDFPTFFDTVKTNIPESSNTTPDILDEIWWNLNWMLSMQDPNDGGVYHKLTNPNFDGTVMPAAATNTRYVTAKGTAAALDFAAVMAQASRVYRKYPKQYPGLADSCLKAGTAALAWANKNPNIEYKNGNLHDPSVVTGEYGDGNFTDEFVWANLEFFATTGDKKYWDASTIESYFGKSAGVPGWPDVATLGIYSVVRFPEVAKKAGVNYDGVKSMILKGADELKESSATSAYAVPMGIKENDFVWGSNSVTANQGIMLIYAYKLTGKKDYLDAAIANLDYLLGRNATGYCFLTGFGDKPSNHVHHRPSEADQVKNAVPGLLAGGPNPAQQDIPHCDKYEDKHSHPATSYLDEHCSYASNEIAINWNAPFAYHAFAVEALKSEKK